MRILTNVRLLIGLCVIFLVVRNIYSYRSTYEYSLQNRAKIAAQNNKKIHVAAVWDLNNNRSFMDGVALAVDEVNQQGIKLESNGKSVNAQIVIHQFDDSTEKNALKSRLKITANHKIVAVLGHSSSVSAIAGSISYEYNGILFISAVATDPELTGHGFKYTFSIIPSADLFAVRIYQFLLKQQWSKLLALHARDHYGLEMFERFASKVELPIQIVSARSFSVEQQDYKPLIYNLLKNDFDAVFLTATDKDAANMIKQLREMGVTKPIIGSDGLDNLNIWSWSENKENQTYVASIFENQDGFVKKFQKVYGYRAGYLAYQGYKAVEVLTDAIRNTGTSEPLRVASTLKYTNNKHGNYEFDNNGLVRNLNIYIKQMKDGKFIYNSQGVKYNDSCDLLVC